MSELHFIIKEDNQVYWMRGVPEKPEPNYDFITSSLYKDTQWYKETGGYKDPSSWYEEALQKAKDNALEVVGLYSKSDLLAYPHTESNGIYTMDLKGYKVEIKEEPEFPGFDHTSYPTFKNVAVISPIEPEDRFYEEKYGEDQNGVAIEPEEHIPTNWIRCKMESLGDHSIRLTCDKGHTLRLGNEASIDFFQQCDKIEPEETKMTVDEYNFNEYKALQKELAELKEENTRRVNKINTIVADQYECHRENEELRKELDRAKELLSESASLLYHVSETFSGSIESFLSKK